MKGIIFTAESVIGIERGVKSQTRRLAKPDEHGGFTAPRYRVGETICVREGWDYVGGNEYIYQQERGAVRYRADRHEHDEIREWRSPLFMPSWAARYHVTITEVRTERLLAISAHDARAEGIEVLDGLLDAAEIFRCAKVAGCSYEDPQATYLAAWDRINPRTPCASKPMVHAYTFTVARVP